MIPESDPAPYLSPVFSGHERTGVRNPPAEGNHASGWHVLGAGTTTWRSLSQRPSALCVAGSSGLIQNQSVDSLHSVGAVHASGTG